MNVTADTAESLAATDVAIAERRDPVDVTELRPAICVLVPPTAAILGVLALVTLGSESITPSDVTRMLLVVAFGGAGVAAGLRRRSDRVAPIAFGGSLIGGAAMLADSLARDTPSSGWSLAARAGLGVVIASGLHLLVALPDGRLKTRGRRAFVGGTYLAFGAVGALSPHDGSAMAWWPLLLAAGIGLPIGATLSNSVYRRAVGADRHRMHWVGWAVMVWVEVALVAGCLHLMTRQPTHLSSWVLGGSIAVAISIGASTHSGLVARVDHLLIRTVALTGLTAAILVTYAAVIVALGRPLHDGERSLLMLSMAAAMVAFVAYLPIRRRLGDIANQFVYGEVVAPDEALRTFGSRMSRTIPMDELLLQMVESLRKTMSLSNAQCWTGGEGRYELAACVPHQPLLVLRIGDKELAVVSRAGISGGTWLGVWLPDLVKPADRPMTRVAPIVHLGKLLGLIVVTRTNGLEFTEDEDRLLTELARQVGLALHNAQLDSALQASLDELRQTNGELVDSRRRIITAGDTERRKLERNLHDGAQQYLVAMAVKLRLVQDLLVDEPDEALGLVGELRTNMTDAIGELRALAHGIYPPLLASGGLSDALASAAARAALPTEFTATGVGRYDPEIEASVYFCCIEAMQNAGKHAGAGASATLTLVEADRVLRFDVRDNGAGFEVSGDRSMGHGFINMADRLGAIGGQLEVSSTQGAGTRISGLILLDPPRTLPHDISPNGARAAPRGPA